MGKWIERRLLPGAIQPKLVTHDGGLCAVLVNTASKKRRSLETYADLLAWGQENGVLELADADRLARAARERPADADAAFARAQELRACLERILVRLVDRHPPATADIDTLNAALSTARSKQVLRRHDNSYQWTWGGRDDDDFDRMLWPVLASASDVLTSKSLFRVRRCAGEDCDLLFVDRTSGLPRKWCSMNSCGSRVSSRKHYRARVKLRQQLARDGMEATLKHLQRQKSEAGGT